MGERKERASGWRGVLGWALLVLGVIDRVIGWAGNIDFVITRSENPGWVGRLLSLALANLGLALILVGVGFIVWNERRRTDRLLEVRLQPAIAETGKTGTPSLSDQLRDVRGGDPLPYYAHVEFLSSAQQEKAERLRNAFELAGWDTNYTSVPHDRYSQRHAIGLEVTAVNGEISKRVAAILNASGFGPTIILAEQPGVKKDSPKWPGAQRTVRLFLGHPPDEGSGAMSARVAIAPIEDERVKWIATLTEIDEFLSRRVLVLMEELRWIRQAPQHVIERRSELPQFSQRVRELQTDFRSLLRPRMYLIDSMGVNIGHGDELFNVLADQLNVFWNRMRTFGGTTHEYHMHVNEFRNPLLEAYTKVEEFVTEAHMQIWRKRREQG